MVEIVIEIVVEIVVEIMFEYSCYLFFRVQALTNTQVKYIKAEA